MPRRALFSSCRILALSVALLTATPLLAQKEGTPADSLRENADLAADASREQGKNSDLLIIPIPHSSPSLGFGLTLGAALFYNPNGSRDPWISGIGAMYSKNDNWGIAAAHKMTLAGDKLRVTAFAGYGSANVEFYGIGPNAGDRNRSIRINDKGLFGLFEAQYRVARDVYVGPRFEYIDLSSRILIPDPLFPDLNLPEAELKSRLSSLGLSVTLDSRDTSLNPRTGDLVTARFVMGVKALGSDFDHNKLKLSANFYRPLDEKTVIAGRASLCGVSRNVPFYDLCQYGSSSDLRGYETGRYRDRASWATQIEMRRHLFGRFGAAAFAGIGGTAPRLSALDESKILPSAGIGLRYQPSRQTDINLRIDYAVGRNSKGLYFGLGEAF